MFAYCGNNPVIRADTSGQFWGIVVLAVVIVASVALTSCSKKTAPDPIEPEDTTAGSTSSTTTGTVETKPPTPGYNDYLDALGARESSDNYSSKKGQYLGRYQMGSSALQDAGFQDSSGNWTTLANSYGVYGPNDFLNSPQAQDVAITNFNMKQCDYIKYYGLDSYIDSEYCGVKVTQSGLLAACHLVGIGTMIKALNDGVAVWDGNGTHASEYMDMFGGYDISEVW